jgi:hypothetical protein
MSPVAQAEKPKRARSRSTASPRRTAGTKGEAAPSNGAPHAAAVDSNEIASLAHALWEARGGQGGSPEDDWYRAEQELCARGVTTGKA